MGYGRGFNYLYLKLVAIILRLIGGWRQRNNYQRDLLLSYGIEPRHVHIQSRNQGRSIEAYLYVPPESDSESGTGDSELRKRKSKKQPILVNWHGSGFVIPSLGKDRAFCARVARESGVVVLDADYRKGPETPFPGAIHDVEDVLRWIADQHQFDLTRVAVSGFSAGGNLALVAASALRQGLLELLQIPIVIAVYPVTDISIDPYEKKVPNPLKPIPAGVARVLDDSYAPNPADRVDPRVSPSLADPASFPDTVVILTCEGDTLSPEANQLAVKLDDGKRKVVNSTLRGVHHGFDKGCREGTPEWEQREIAYSLIIRTLKEVFHL